MNKNRRAFLTGGSSAGAAAWLLINQKVSANILETKAQQPAKKLVWVLLRGAMDSLHGVIPYADPHLRTHRAQLSDAIRADALPLSDGFSLHPALRHMHKMYLQKQMSVVVAVASGYRERSHFDGQDQMESGLDQTNHDSGWLARAMETNHKQGVAISQTIPIAMRGKKPSDSWYPPYFQEASQDTLQRLKSLYAGNVEFSDLLGNAINSRDKFGMNDQTKYKTKFNVLAKRCGEFLHNDAEANCAMLEMGGWDTHNNQQSRLANQFNMLDQAMAELKQGLAKSWNNTVVLISTEFGRTVAINGTQGTDHGTGSAMFMLGGSVKGGKIHGEWPGLREEQLFEKRDLQPTSDIRSWMGSVLHQHWGMSHAQLGQVFPDVQPKLARIIV